MANTSCSRVPALRWRTGRPSPKAEARRPKQSQELRRQMPLDFQRKDAKVQQRKERRSLRPGWAQARLRRQARSELISFAPWHLGVFALIASSPDCMDTV